MPLLDDEALGATVSLNSDLKTSVDINAMQQEQNEALQNEIEDLLREREQFKQFLMKMVKTSYKFASFGMIVIKNCVHFGNENEHNSLPPPEKRNLFLNIDLIHFFFLQIAGWETRLSIFDFCDENEVCCCTVI